MDIEKGFRDFLRWEAATRDTLDVKRIYIDMAGDLAAGVMLSEIVFWYLPNEQGTSKLRVERDGYSWIAIRRTEWWDRCRLTPEQADYALGKLIKRGLVEKRVFKFNGNPTVHIRLKVENFLATFRAALGLDQESDRTEKGNGQEGETEVGNFQSGFGKFPSSTWEISGKPLTETTNIAINPPPPPAQHREKSHEDSKLGEAPADASASPVRTPSAMPGRATCADQAERLYRRLRPNHRIIPRGWHYSAARNVLNAILDEQGGNVDAAEAILRPYVQEADRRGIVPTNLCWLTEWAAAGAVPPRARKRAQQGYGRRSNAAPAETKHEETEEELAERRRRVAEIMRPVIQKLEERQRQQQQQQQEARWRH